MKRVILTVAGLGTAIALGFYVNRAKSPVISPEETVVEPAPAETIENQIARTPYSPARPEPDRQQVATEPLKERDQSVKAERAAQEPPGATDGRWVLDQAIEILVSPQAGFEQKQAAWKRLKETGKLDEAIGELEQRRANDPRTAEYAAALGQAYLKKCAGMENVREQAMLAMKADQALEGALSLDPSNWEARYTRAVGMSYWPAQLDKQQEVIEQFRTLIEQQEAQAQQPHFARSYTWLGDQYQKAGRADYAAQVWQRGAALFPNNEELKGKLASAP